MRDALLVLGTVLIAVALWSFAWQAFAVVFGAAFVLLGFFGDVRRS